MKYTITFNENLPFKPERNQVIYIGPDNNTLTTRIVAANYEFLKRKFAVHGLEFVFLPMLFHDADVERKVRYYAPYIQSQVVETTPLSSSLLLNYLSEESRREEIQPSFIYKGRQKDDGWVFDATTLDINSQGGIGYLLPIVLDVVGELGWPGDVNLSRVDERILSTRQSETRKQKDNKGNKWHIPSILQRLNHSYCPDKMDEVEERLEPVEQATEPAPYEISGQDVSEILSDLQDAVSRLRLKGVTLMAIHEMIDKQEPLSRLVITPDYRLLLPDYNNMEIEMDTLPKAIFFLFLRYPEGIVFKSLPDHYTELLNIYRQLRPGSNEERMKVTITKVTNPLGNAINENVARIRKAFVEKFDEHLAQNYFVRGERAGRYGISLDRSLVVWEE